MTVTFSLQIKGYWLSFFAWLILTFAPIASSFAQSDEGFLRLCTSKGSQWVQQIGSQPDPNDNHCVCLSDVISFEGVPFTSSNLSANNLLSVQINALTQLGFVNYNPRAPPLLS